MFNAEDEAKRVAKEQSGYDKEKKVKVTAITDNQDDDGATVNLWGFPFACKTIDDDGIASTTYTAMIPESVAKQLKKAKKVT